MADKGKKETNEPRTSVKITKRQVEALSAGERDRFLWDCEVRGFGVRVTPKGVKSFVLQYRPSPGGRSTPARRFTIGVYGSPWTADRARQEAQRLLIGIRDGRDPLSQRQSDRGAITVSQLCDEYLEAANAGLIRDRKGKPKSMSTLATDRGRIARHIKPLLGKRRVKDLVRDDIQKFHDDVKAGKTRTSVKTERSRAIVTGGRGAAARTTGLLGGLLTFAVDKKYLPVNPARGVKREPDKKVETFLSSDQFAALGRALSDAEREWSAQHAALAEWQHTRVGKRPSWPKNTVSPTAAAAIRLLILTGCRKSEITTLQWDFVDFEQHVLKLPTSKNEADKKVLVGPPALEILSALPHVCGNPFVFPGMKQGRPIVGLYKMWKRVCDRAGIANVRPHDLRHSFASVMAGAGDSLLMIGKLLGHKHATTTERYAHLGPSPVREAKERQETRLGSLLESNLPAKVYPIRG